MSNLDALILRKNLRCHHKNVNSILRHLISWPDDPLHLSECVLFKQPRQTILFWGVLY